MRIMFVGDINLGEYYTAFGHGPRSYLDNSDIFSGVKDILSQADLVAGNLEASITDHGYIPGLVESAVLRAAPKHANYLSEAGFSILQLANNHTVQHGAEGFEETVINLRRLGIAPIGINNQELTKVIIGSQTVGFLAASDVPDNTDISQKCYQKLDDKFFDRTREGVSSVDHLFVMLHWGLESSTGTLAYQKRIINELYKAGVRGVIGSHPHLFYELWKNGNFVAAPSLGNFVFDLFWDWRLLKSGILDIELSKTEITTCRIWPVTISEDGGRPVPSGSPVELNNTLKLYDLGRDMRGEQKRKLIKFFRDFFKGNRKLKTQFIIKKLTGKI
ncbi:CapA family protein [Marinobacter lacisalsi]|uniref:CapA family protein n=1 Tax=Marinobacter lacisalsi TaxID=475979 RepID=A0ABV8QDX9_9GAMM